MKTQAIKDKIVGYLGIFLTIIFSISLARGVSRVRLVKDEIAKRQAEVAKMERDNEILKEELAKVQSPQYIEKEIRNKLGLVKTGEIIVVLPEPEVVKSLAPTIPEDDIAPPDPNWKRWLRLFM